MGLTTEVWVGFANGDVHITDIPDRLEASRIATREAKGLGKLTNAGFCVVVASAWYRDETKTAGLAYAATWRENEVLVLLHYGDRIASSHALYARRHAAAGKGLTASELLEFCRQLKMQ